MMQQTVWTASHSCLRPDQLLRHPACRERWLQRHGLRCMVAQGDAAESRHILADGTELEVLHQPAHKDTRLADKPPLLFVHGAYHGAWCWKEHWMPWFSQHGYSTYAVSMRCHGASGGEHEGGNTLSTHTEDLGHLIRSLPAAPVLIGHSFGGLLAECYLSNQAHRRQDLPRLPGAVLLCPGAPSGNKGIVQRLLWKNFFLGIWLSWAFIMGRCMHNADAFRGMFLSRDVQPELNQRYFELMRAAKPRSPLVNISKLKDEVPLEPPGGGRAPACLVMGGSEDIIMDEQGCQETATWCGGDLVFLPGLAHDLMLGTQWEASPQPPGASTQLGNASPLREPASDTRWEVAAERTLAWLNNLQPSTADQPAAA